ncbi:MAG: DUF2147 domain-containing protein [Xanthomonas sp.]
MQASSGTKRYRAVGLVVAGWLLAPAVGSAAPASAQGLWLTAAKDAVVEFAPCADAATALCGRIVWDKDAGTATDTCGVQIARLGREDGDTWREGWAFDPRSGKRYKATLRASGNALDLRAFVGVEVLGETERFTRVQALPGTPVCAR